MDKANDKQDRKLTEQEYQLLIAELELNKKIIKQLQDHIEFLYNSKTWRWTQRIRRFYSLLKRWVAAGRAYLMVLRQPYRLWANLKHLKKVLQECGWYAAYQAFTAKSRSAFSMGNYNHHYVRWLKYNDYLTTKDEIAIRQHIQQLPVKPLFTVILTVPANYNANWLNETVAAIMQQYYTEWELIMALPAELHAEPLFSDLAKDSRIKIQSPNQAIAAATGSWLMFLSVGNVLAKHALYMYANSYKDNPNAAIIYSDEDYLLKSGLRYEPRFKTAWNRFLFYANNYLNNAFVINKSLVTKINGASDALEGAELFDLLLKAIEQINDANIFHIPFVLQHTLIAETPNNDDVLANRNAIKALQQHFERTGIAADVHYQMHDHKQRKITYKLPNIVPKVSIIIPTRDRVDLLRVCVDSILAKTSYANYEVIIMDNNSVEEATKAYFEKVISDKRVRIVPHNYPFNWSEINNAGVRLATGDIVCLMNNDMEIINQDWLTELASLAMLPNVGAVGAKLYYPDDTIQHAGVALGIGGVGTHIMRCYPKHANEYLGYSLVCHQEYSAVTGACMAMRKDVFEKVGSLDETLAVAFNDVELCIRLKKAGYKIVWTPFAEIYHYESATRGSDFARDKVKRFYSEMTYIKAKHDDYLLNDPYYNPNFSLVAALDFSYPPRVKKPWLEVSA